MGRNRWVARTNNYNISPQFFCQLIDFIPHATKTDMLFNAGRIDGEVADHRLQTFFCFMLQMLFKTTHISGKTVQAQAG